MGFRMRKSIKVASGVRVNVSKRGVGASVGGRGGRYSVHSSGRHTVSAGSGVVPGVYYQKSVSGKGSSRGGSHAAAAPAAAPVAPKKPGMFAPKGEKQLYKAIQAQDAQAIGQAGAEYPDFRLPSYSLAGLMLLTSEPKEAERLLGEAFATGKDPAEDKFVAAYLFTRLELAIAEGITAELPVNRDAVGLALAELAFREQGFHDAAHEALKEALRSRSRAAPIRHQALAERAQNYLDQGKKAMARKDLERILAEDSSYEGVREQLADLTA
jgi:tetratricopeptide (TPR) repeat protein